MIYQNHHLRRVTHAAYVMRSTVQFDAFRFGMVGIHQGANTALARLRQCNGPKSSPYTRTFRRWAYYLPGRAAAGGAGRLRGGAAGRLRHLRAGHLHVRWAVVARSTTLRRPRPRSRAGDDHRLRGHRRLLLSMGGLAKNPEPERLACEIRLRAESRAGQLLAQMEKAKVARGSGSNQHELRSHGVPHELSRRAGSARRSPRAGRSWRQCRTQQSVEQFHGEPYEGEDHSHPVKLCAEVCPGRGDHDAARHYGQDQSRRYALDHPRSRTMDG